MFKYSNSVINGRKLRTVFVVLLLAFSSLSYAKWYDFEPTVPDEVDLLAVPPTVLPVKTIFNINPITGAKALKKEYLVRQQDKLKVKVEIRATPYYDSEAKGLNTSKSGTRVKLGTLDEDAIRLSLGKALAKDKWKKFWNVSIKLSPAPYILRTSTEEKVVEGIEESIELNEHFLLEALPPKARQGAKAMGFVGAQQDYVTQQIIAGGTKKIHLGAELALQAREKEVTRRLDKIIPMMALQNFGFVFGIASDDKLITLRFGKFSPNVLFEEKYGDKSHFERLLGFNNRTQRMAHAFPGLLASVRYDQKLEFFEKKGLKKGIDGYLSVEVAFFHNRIGFESAQQILRHHLVMTDAEFNRQSKWYKIDSQMVSASLDFPYGPDGLGDHHVSFHGSLANYDSNVAGNVGAEVAGLKWNFFVDYNRGRESMGDESFVVAGNFYVIGSNVMTESELGQMFSRVGVVAGYEWSENSVQPLVSTAQRVTTKDVFVAIRSLLYYKRHLMVEGDALELELVAKHTFNLSTKVADNILDLPFYLDVNNQDDTQIGLEVNYFFDLNKIK